MAMRFAFDCACALLGSVTVSTPFLKEAVTLSSSMSRPTCDPAWKIDPVERGIGVQF
jgi:hypothetical protein